jgi:hypothetical protein
MKGEAKRPICKRVGCIEFLHLLYQALSNDAAGDEIDLGHYLSQMAAAVMDTCAVDGVRLDQKMEYAPVSANTRCRWDWS